MKRFEFPLETVRRWRFEQVALEELKLRKILAERSAIVAARREIEDEGVRTARQVLEQSTVEPLELESLDSFRLYVRGRMRDFDHQERRCEARIIEQRNQVMEARRQFELLDRLRQKLYEEWRAAGNKEQEELAAELFLAKSVRERRRR
jgi:hypothetical protein